VFRFREDVNYSAYAADLGQGVFASTPFKSGDHRVDGICVAWGGGIANVDRELRFQIEDVLPTVMHLNGRAVPSVCDGRVREEILSEPQEIRYDTDWQRFLAARQEIAYGADQEAEIRERLQALGYLSEDD
jgi:hypothetical protein